MSLNSAEIRPGIIAILDPKLRFQSGSVRYEGDRKDFRPGPLLCVHVGWETSVWLNVTSKNGFFGDRMELKPEWRLDRDSSDGLNV